MTKDQSLEIYLPVRLQPHRLVILWDPATEFHYQHQMEVEYVHINYIVEILQDSLKEEQLS